MTLEKKGNHQGKQAKRGVPSYHFLSVGLGLVLESTVSFEKEEEAGRATSFPEAPQVT